MLIGYAGTGKTTLTQAFVAQALDRGLRVCACAPTHKAVDVIAGKMREARIEVECRTLHSLLGLRPCDHPG